MTATLRPLFSFAFAALLALSLFATANDAIAKTTGTNALPALLDRGFEDDQGSKHGRPLGRLGVSWE